MDGTPDALAGLIAEHRAIEAVVAETRSRVAAALAAPDDVLSHDVAIEQLWALQLVLELDVEHHIAKEEVVLFPCLRRELSRLNTLVDALIDEHDRIKGQRDRLSEALALLDDEHTDVRAATARLRAGLDQVQIDAALGSLSDLDREVERLDWLFQGHFVGEEDGLFAPAEELLTAATFAELARQMEELDAQQADTAL